MGLRSVKFQWQLDGERTAGGGGGEGGAVAGRPERHFARGGILGETRKIGPLEIFLFAY